MARPRKRWVKWLRGVGIAIAVLLVLVAGALVFVLETDRGTRFAAEQGLRRYSASIPGSITFGRIEGRVGDTVCIHDLRLADAAGHDLVTIETVCLELRVSRLLRRAVEVDSLHATAAVVHLWPDANWGDLSAPKPEPPDALPGPDLGITLAGPVEVERFALVRHGRQGDERLVEYAGLRGELWAEGRKATASIDELWAFVSPAEVLVVSGAVELGWDSPELTVDDLVLVTNVGVVESVDGWMHVLDERYEASVEAVAFPPGDAPVSLAIVDAEIGGTFDTAGASVHVLAPEYGTLHVHAMAGLGDVRRANIVGALEPAHDASASGIHFVAGAELAGDHRTAHAIASAHDTVAVAILDGDDARAFVSMPGTGAEAAVRLRDDAVQSARAHVSVSSASQTLAELERLLPRPVPELPGAVSGEVEASCTHPEAWRCLVEASVRLDDDWLGTRAEIVADADAVNIAVERLAGQIRREPVRLAAPARVSVEGGAATLRDVQLFAAGGRIDASGTLAWKDAPLRSDLAVKLRSVDLATVQRFAPGVPIRGELDGSVRLVGTAARPELDASLTAADLRWEEQALGTVALDAHYADGTAHGRVTWTHERSKASIAAVVPIRVRLSGAEKVELRRRRPALLSVAVERFPLEDLDPWLHQELRGRVDVTLHAAGSLDDPTLVASITGAHLEHRERDVGNAALALAYRDGVVHANLRAAGSGADAVVAARLPIAIDLVSGRVRHDARAEHRLAALVGHVELEQLEPWLGHRRLGGIVGGEVALKSVDGEATAELLLVGREVHIDGYELGAAELRVFADSDGTEVDMQMSGPDVRLVELMARVPVQLRGPTRLPKWRSEQPFIVSAELRDVDLDTVTRIAGAPAMAGDLDGALLLAGTGTDPQLQATFQVQGLATRGKELGFVRMAATYDEGELVAEVQQRNGIQQIVGAGRVPLSVVLDPPKVAWHRDRAHTLSLHAKGIDQDVVGAFVELPSELRLRAAADFAFEGTADEPHADLRLRGSAASGNAMPSPVSVLAAIEPSHQQARIMVGGRGPTGLVVDAEANVVLRDLFAGKADLSAVVIDVDAHARDFHLTELAPLLPNLIHEPRGMLQLSASMKGPIGAPDLQGQLFMKNGEFTLVPFNQRFKDVDIVARLAGPDVEIERFTARSGEGSLSITAALHVAPGETKGDATVIARKLPVVRPGLPMMTVSTRIDVDLDATGEMTQLALVAHDGFIDVLDLKAGNAAQAIPEDDGVTYVDAKGRRQAVKGTEKARTPWIPRDLALTVRLADLVRVRGASADMDWGGQVKVVRRAGAEPTATGALSTNAGRVSLLGNDFAIDHGKITLPRHGELDPYIDLVATTDTEEALVTMRVQGRVSRPSLRLRSEPQLPESDIFALLLTGHADAAEAQEGDFSAKAASLLAAFENPALQQQLRRTVGIDRAGIGFGETVEQPIVTVGKRITRKVYVEASYHHNAPPEENEAEVRLEYRFKPPSWSVETYFGDAAAGGIGVWWRRRFGRPAKRPPKIERKQAKR
jgi:autotransporter translocation and assembly factor TamB